MGVSSRAKEKPQQRQEEIGKQGALAQWDEDQGCGPPTNEAVSHRATAWTPVSKSDDKTMRGPSCESHKSVGAYCFL